MVKAGEYAPARFVFVGRRGRDAPSRHGTQYSISETFRHCNNKNRAAPHFSSSTAGEKLVYYKK